MIFRPPSGSLIYDSRVDWLSFWGALEGGGNLTLDSSGNGFHHSLVNVAWGMGDSGPHLDFNGTTSYCTVSNQRSGYDQIWWLVKMYPRTVSGIHGVLDHYNPGSGNAAWRVYQNNAGMSLQIYDGASDETQTISGVLSSNTWHTFLFSFNQGVYQAWRKLGDFGVIETLSTSDFAVASIIQRDIPTYIGRRATEGTTYFNGLVEFAGIGLGGMNTSLATDLIERPFADFTLPDTDEGVFAETYSGLGMPGGFSSLAMGM